MKTAPENGLPHPVESGDFIIPTPVICSLSDLVDHWTNLGSPGGMVIGPSRFGKTRAIQYIQREREGELPVFYVVVLHDNMTANQFYGYLLMSVGHKDAVSGTRMQKWIRLISFLQARGLEGGKKKLLLLIDDAQKMTENQLGCLCDIYNALDLKGIVPCFILAGEESLLGIREALKSSGKTQIIGRFMTTVFHFDGVSSAQELRECLSYYDKSTFPKGSNITYTEEYFTNAFKRGWRLADQAELLYQAFQKVHEESKVAWKFVLPMQYIVHAVRYAFQQYKDKSSAFSGFSFSQWGTAVRYAYFIDAGSYLAPPSRIKR